MSPTNIRDIKFNRSSTQSRPKLQVLRAAGKEHSHVWKESRLSLKYRRRRRCRFNSSSSQDKSRSNKSSKKSKTLVITRNLQLQQRATIGKPKITWYKASQDKKPFRKSKSKICTKQSLKRARSKPNRIKSGRAIWIEESSCSQ